MTSHLLIFNLDGSVIDTNNSISSAIRRTVQNYFSHFLGIHGSGSLVSEETVRLFWQAGVDDPQELSAGLIGYLLNLLPEKFHSSRPPRNIFEAAAFLKKTSQSIQHISTTYLQKKANFSQLIAATRKAGGGRKGFQKVIGRYLKHPLLLSTGDIDKSNLVGRLYIEFYLGYKNCYRVERVRPRFYRKAGLIENESLLINNQSLQQIRRAYKHRMAIITNRKLANAKFIMQQYQLEHFFDAVITNEDIIAEQARRRRLKQDTTIALPLSFMLLEAIEHLDYQGTQPVLYVGNQPHDVLVARKAASKSKRDISNWQLRVNSDTSSTDESDQEAEHYFNDAEALTKALVNH